MTCTSVQTFCSTCQIVKEHPDIFCEGQTTGFQFSNSTETKTKAMSSFINEAIDALQKISEYGNFGDKNPTPSELYKLNKVEKSDKIKANEYNLLMEILKVENIRIESKDKLLGSYFVNLKEYIDNYKLNNDRCVNCNNICQSGQSGDCDSCQYSSQGSCNSCQSNCQGLCQSVCQSCEPCEGTCEGGCMTNCERHCMLADEDTFECGGSCQGLCQFQCQDICEKTCQGSCQNTCESGVCQVCQSGQTGNCSVNCMTSDMACDTCEACQDNCQLTCQDSCQLACQSCQSCQTACQLACQSCQSCQLACQLACQSCQDSCQSGQGGNCTVNCMAAAMAE